MKIDLLKQIYYDKLSEDAVDQIYDDAMDNPANGSWNESLSLDNLEATAFMHGATFHEIAIWRYEGWPMHCTICGEEISLWNGGWTISHKHSYSSLVHIDCKKTFTAPRP